MFDNMVNKIVRYPGESGRMRVEMLDDAEIALLSYGFVSRAALLAVTLARVVGV